MKTNKSAIVTGASSGIGLETSKLLAQNGYVVSGIARDFSHTDTGHFNAVPLDLSDLESLPPFLKQAQIMADTLVMSAGYGRFGGLEQFSHQQIRHLIDTNLVSQIYLLKHYLPLMKQQGGGDVVIVGSESAIQGARAGAVYCATKFALRGLAQSIRADSSTANVRVIMVNPGPVDSDFFDELDFTPQPGDDYAISPESVAGAILHALQQPRNVVIEEINLQPMKRSFKKK